MYCFKLLTLKAHRFHKIDWILASGLIGKDVWLAGGALRTVIDANENIVDYDLFFRNINTLDRIGHLYSLSLVDITKNKLTKLGFKCTFECPEGKLYTYELDIGNSNRKIYSIDKIKVQLITEFFYESPEHLLSTFDLSPTYFCTDGEYLWTSKNTIRSVKKKICSLLKLTYPISTFKRIIKYSSKGYDCLDAIKGVVGNLLESSASKYTQESMRVYID